MPLRKVVFATENRDLVVVGSQKVLDTRLRGAVHLRGCDYFDGGNPLVLVDLELFDEFTHPEVPNLNK